MCSVNCVVKTVRVIEQSANNGGNQKKNMTFRHLLHVDSFGCLSNHGFDAFSANTVKRESTNHGFNACNSDVEERIDQPRFHWAQRQHCEERIERGHVWLLNRDPDSPSQAVQPSTFRRTR